MNPPHLKPEEQTLYHAWMTPPRLEAAVKILRELSEARGLLKRAAIGGHTCEGREEKCVGCDADAYWEERGLT